ncbi:MAG: hypothetical protein ABI434_00715 [Burkholderiaceae bacterium]
MRPNDREMLCQSGHLKGIQDVDDNCGHPASLDGAIEPLRDDELGLERLQPRLKRAFAFVEIAVDPFCFGCASAEALLPAACLRLDQVFVFAF